MSTEAPIRIESVEHLIGILGEAAEIGLDRAHPLVHFLKCGHCVSSWF
jgi:hypothetical protein